MKSMILFIKGIIIGIGKIVPGVSGAVLAVILKVYDKGINAIVNFKNDIKNKKVGEYEEYSLVPKEVFK